jgi:hypothetical protein
MEQEGDYIHNRVHLKPLQLVMQIREDARADDGGGAHIGLVEKLASPMLNKSGGQGASETEAEVDKPERIAYDG